MELSYKAKGILGCMILSSSPIEFKELLNNSRDNKDSFLSGIAELEEKGFIKKSSEPEVFVFSEYSFKNGGEE